MLFYDVSTDFFESVLKVLRQSDVDIYSGVEKLNSVFGKDALDPFKITESNKSNQRNMLCTVII